MPLFDSFASGATGPESRTQQTFARKPPSRGSWATTNSKQMLRNYDRSPVTSPTSTPPLSRSNSSSSVNSIQSEPAWPSNRHTSTQYDPPRKQSGGSTPHGQSDKKERKGGLKTWLFGEKDGYEKAKKKKQDNERIVLGSSHAAKVKARMATDPQYQEFLKKHQKPNVKTANIAGDNPSSYSTAAQHEMRYPHSGPPQVHTLDLPALSKIESLDEADDTPDPFESRRREWTDAEEHNLRDIPEIRSRGPSRIASPIHSRESSPNGRLTSGVAAATRPALGSSRSSWTGAGQYQRDATGRWRKSPPSGRTPGTHSGARTPTTAQAIMPQPGDMTPDLLAKSLAERLNTVGR